MKADRLVLGLALLAAGIIWVLVNLGVIPARTAMEFWRFWPLLLVVWGVLLLSGKGGGASGCLITLFVILLIISTTFYVFSFPFYRGPAGPVTETGIELPVSETIKRLNLDLVHHAGEFTLAAGIAADHLLKASFATTHGPPEVEQTVQADTATVLIRDLEISRSWQNRVSRWTVYLNPDTPAQISLRTGATRAGLDMRRLQVERLEIKTGAGDLSVYLGAYDGEVTIDSGAGNIVIYVPHDTGIRMQVSGGIINVRGENARLESHGNRYYTSSGLEEKGAVIDIRITAGAGSITVKPAPLGNSL